MRNPFGNRMLRRIGTTTVAVLIIRGYDRRLYDRCEVVVGLLVWAVAKRCNKLEQTPGKVAAFQTLLRFRVLKSSSSSPSGCLTGAPKYE